MGESHIASGYLLNLPAFLLADAFAHASRQAEDRVYLPPAHGLDDPVVFFAGVYHLPPQLQTNLGNHSQDIALGHGSIRSHDKIGTGQYVKMCSVVSDEECAIKQLAYLPGRAGRLGMEHGVQRLG